MRPTPKHICLRLLQASDRTAAFKTPIGDVNLDEISDHVRQRARAVFLMHLNNTKGVVHVYARSKAAACTR
jgi:hypothetical protein